ncbi:beta-glucosidase family protein [Lacrimispora defluvii]|uniref:Glycosyl hydrolase n=1 Tax=Lacrimispora defluvii TaxID=2719233 RepID=A0ABX1VST6_9FIRM|nr:glycoside hydrolase family 3 C-terminal domain-containing protein [Lacrimispora defluvii]NNJ30336.1 glycosyl hydrolase [Lacrimispora defluvii]
MERHEIEKLIKELTLEEKIGMIHGQGIFHTGGVTRFDIPPLWMSDGPMGVRRELEDDNWNPSGTTDDFVSYLPSNTALACTWNRRQAEQMGRVLGAEARGRGKDVILAPGINIIRTPLCGRNFEYMSEDPYLTAQLAVPLIRGIQENDTAACVKHFAVNNQETNRLTVSVEVCERALREIYLPGFEAAVKEGKSMTIMGAYNKLRGEFCCHNPYLLREILRKEWNFDGVVISDWGAVHNTTEAALGGLDIEMSVTNDFDDYYMADPLYKKVLEKEVDEEIINEKVRHILILMNHLSMLGEERKNRTPGVFNISAHQEGIRSCGEEAVVLLKNEDDRLPIMLEGKKRLAIIGENAAALHAPGGGSAGIKALYEISPLMGLKIEAGGNIAVDYELGVGPEGLKKAGILAAECEDVIVFTGLNHQSDVEGQDRNDMKLPAGQEELISAVLDVNENAVIVVLAGSPVEIEAFADRAKAIVYTSYNGMEGGRALARVLLGNVNPSGKLPFTLPRCLEDCPAHKLGEFPGDETVVYREGVFVGYRYFESEQVPVRYCFGHGLSYTEYGYENLRVEKTSQGYLVKADVENCGNQSGFETVQVYVRAAGKTIKRPVMELRGFDKIFLEPGEKRTLAFCLTEKDFSYYNEELKCFAVPEDEYDICVGSSVSDIRLKKRIEVDECILEA